ncbi:hypothetical protein PR048_028136 [Dryococelus australis]|uniref:Uncharacterized protein n=1 Tax=Dryococelus australis TaxID=614101 RepID=A0ABQ9GIF5_9NEOP|nr:hypothetical protein PR048_028136 [Dryococelus australis]
MLMGNFDAPRLCNATRLSVKENALFIPINTLTKEQTRFLQQILSQLTSPSHLITTHVQEVINGVAGQQGRYREGDTKDPTRRLMLGTCAVFCSQDTAQRIGDPFGSSLGWFGSGRGGEGVTPNFDLVLRYPPLPTLHSPLRTFRDERTLREGGGFLVTITTDICQAYSATYTQRSAHTLKMRYIDRTRWLGTTCFRVPKLNCFPGNTGIDRTRGQRRVHAQKAMKLGSQSVASVSRPSVQQSSIRQLKAHYGNPLFVNPSMRRTNVESSLTGLPYIYPVFQLRPAGGVRACRVIQVRGDAMRAVACACVCVCGHNRAAALPHTPRGNIDKEGGVEGRRSRLHGGTRFTARRLARAAPVAMATNGPRPWLPRYSVMSVHDEASTLEINLRKNSLSLPAYILTGELSGMRPVNQSGAVVVQRLDYSPPTMANRVRFLAGVSFLKGTAYRLAAAKFE